MNQGTVHYLPFLWHRIHAATGQAHGVKRDREQQVQQPFLHSPPHELNPYYFDYRLEIREK